MWSCSKIEYLKPLWIEVQTKLFSRIVQLMFVLQLILNNKIT